MRFKFTLSHSILGSLEISEPDGWKATVLKLERHEEYHSLIEYFDGDFVFYGQTDDVNGGIDFIRQVETSYGADAELGITIEIAPDNYTFQTVFIGQLDLWNGEELPDNKMKIPIIRNDFWAKFINRLETPVNIQDTRTLDNDPINSQDNISVQMLSQKIRKTTRYEGAIFPSSGDPLTQYDLPTGDPIDDNGADDDYTVYTQAALDLVQDEIEDAFSFPFAFTDLVGIFNVIEFIDEGGPLHIDINAHPKLLLHGGLTATSGEADPSSIDEITILATLFVQKNGEAAIALDFAAQSIPGPTNPIIGFPVSFDFFYDLPLSGSVDFTVEPTDIITIYIRYEIMFDIDIGSDPGSIEWVGPRYVAFTSYESDVEFTLQSTFQENNAQGFFIHDVGGHIVDRMVSVGGSFYSKYLGSDQTIYRQYDDEGCKWRFALFKGLQLRRYSLVEKPFFQTFKQWWEGANPIFNLGLGYEMFNGAEVIRVEEKRHFYDTDVSLNIDYVRDIVRKYDDNRVFKSVKIGYKKWQSEDIAGIDDPQTKHTYATILTKGGKEITLESEFIAASLAIETTRRKTREKSADYKFDNDTFIIAINPDPITISPETSPNVTDYVPELDENFDAVENLLNSDTRYNLRLTPARNFLEWRDWLSASLQPYLSSSFKFASGEGNYDMESVMDDEDCPNPQLTLSEKQNLDISSSPFHLASLYELTIPMDWDDYVTIRDNRKKAIGISQTNENHVKFFIKELDYKVVEGEASIQAWALTPFPIEVIESITPQLICEPLVPCEDAYLTELVEELITESGDCLILN